MKFRIFSIIILTSLFISTTGCNSTNADINGKLSKDQVLRLTIPTKITKFDSAVASDPYAMTIISNVGEGLMRLNNEDKPIPGIAKNVQLSPDQMTYTFTLRDAEWSDGKPVTAHDFEFAWKRTLAPSTRSSSAYLFYPIINAENYHKGEVKDDKVGIKAIDDHTLQVRLNRPVTQFYRLVSLSPFLPVREDVVNKSGKEYGRDLSNMVFNGPFLISGISKSGTIVLRKNFHYWDQQPVYLDTVYFYISKDPVENLNLYTANKIDQTRLEQKFVSAFQNNPEFRTTQINTTEYIKFNFRNKFLQNKKIRQAISYAINRDYLVETLTNRSQPAGALIPSGMEGVKSTFRQESNLPSPKQDIEKARQLFSEGLDEMGLKKPPVSLVMLSYQDERQQLALELKKQLKETLGLTILLNTTSRPEKRHLEQKGEFDLALSDWAETYSDPASFLETFTSDHPLNTGKHQDAPFDGTILRAVNSVEISQQIKYLIQAERFLIQDDQALVPIYYVSDTYLVKNNVKGFIRHSFGPMYSLKWVYILEPEN